MRPALISAALLLALWGMWGVDARGPLASGAGTGLRVEAGTAAVVRPQGMWARLDRPAIPHAAEGWRVATARVGIGTYRPQCGAPCNSVPPANIADFRPAPPWPRAPVPLLGAVVRAAPGDEERQEWLIRTAFCESRYDATAVGDGGESLAEWQVKPRFWGDVPETLDERAQQVVDILDEEGDWPWRATRDGCAAWEGWR